MAGAHRAPQANQATGTEEAELSTPEPGREDPPPPAMLFQLKPSLTKFSVVLTVKEKCIKVTVHVRRAVMEGLWNREAIH